MNRLAELTRCRAAAALSEEDCLIWFGVGHATLERIEAGEVEPEPELEQKIDRFLKVCGGGFLSFPPSAPHPPVTHNGGSLDGGGAGAVASGVPAAFPGGSA